MIKLRETIRRSSSTDLPSRFAFCATCFATVLLVAAVAHGAPSAWQTAKLQADDALLFRLTDEAAQELLEETGFDDVQIDERDEGRTTFVFTTDGVEVFLRNYHETDDIRIYIVYENSALVDRETVELANRWNREERWAKCYLDDDENWVLEADLIIEPGVSREAITAFLHRFLRARQPFERHVGVGR